MAGAAVAPPSIGEYHPTMRAAPLRPAVVPGRLARLARGVLAGAAAATVALAALAGPAAAQSRGDDDVPSRYRPPAGMCRVWIDGVPAARQPAPTDCPTAIRNRPANARVIFGEQPAAVQPRGLRPSERPDSAKPRREKKPKESAERAVVDEARKLLERRRKP